MNDSLMTPAEAAALLDADKQQRAHEYAAYIEAGGKQFRCDLLAIPQLSADGRIVAVMQIVAR